MKKKKSTKLKNHKTVKPEKSTKNYNWKNGLIFLAK